MRPSIRKDDFSKGRPDQLAHDFGRRKFLRCCAGAAAAGLLAPGAGCGRSDASRKSTLSLWSMWTGKEEQNFLRVLDLYQKSHPDIVLDNLGAIRDDTKTVRAIVAGAPPDIFSIYEPLYVGSLAANGALYQLDDWLHQAGLRNEDFVEASLGMCRFEGRLYGLPYLVDIQALLWNKRHFQAAGLDPESPPRTLEELESFALQLTKRNPDGSLKQLGMCPLNNRTFSAGDIYLLFQFNGGTLYDEAARRVTPDDPANVEALTWYARLIERLGGARQVNSFAAGFGQAQGGSNPFYMGKISMMINGEWNPYWITIYAPGLEYGVGPFPPFAAKPQYARSTWFGGNVFCIPKGSAHPRAAWELLLWMQSVEAQVLFADLMNNVPNRRLALRSPALREGAPYKAIYSKFLDLAETPHGGHFPIIPVSNLYHQEILNALDLVIDGQKTPGQALADVRIRVQKELDRYR